MQVQYNILIKPKFDNNISHSVQKDCIKATEKFLGEHYVNQFGRMFDGLDKNCETYYEADFDFFNRYEKGTLDDAIKRLDKKKLFLGGDEQIEFEQEISFFKKFKNFMEVRDPTIFFYNSWGKYRNSNVPEQFKIETPLGLQDTHVHIIPNFSIIQFYKPIKENCWYDYYMLKNFAWDAEFTLLDLNDEWRSTGNLLKKYYLIPKQILQVKKVAEYHNKLMRLDNIAKIDIDNDYELPEIDKE